MRKELQRPPFSLPQQGPFLRVTPCTLDAKQLKLFVGRSDPLDSPASGQGGTARQKGAVESIQNVKEEGWSRKARLSKTGEWVVVLLN